MGSFSLSPRKRRVFGLRKQQQHYITSSCGLSHSIRASVAPHLSHLHRQHFPTTQKRGSPCQQLGSHLALHRRRRRLPFKRLHLEPSRQPPGHTLTWLLKSKRKQQWHQLGRRTRRRRRRPPHLPRPPRRRRRVRRP